MKNFFNNIGGDPNGGVVVVKRTEPGMCGGTDATQDTRAPKEIVSDEMIFFDVTSALGGMAAAPGTTQNFDPSLGYVSAFAAPAAEGTFLFLSTFRGFGFGTLGERRSEWAYVKEDIFPKLVALARECDLARGNGYHSETHGLPQNFGGRIDIRYASGERISTSNNQSPVLSPVAATRIADVFGETMKGERVLIPDVSALRQIRFEETRDGGGFTEAVLTIAPDGTALNEQRSRYEDPTVYESTKSVDKETVDGIKKNILDTGILAWESLPGGGGVLPGREKRITFVFDGDEICVKEGKTVPFSISRGFFNIELEMTIKH